MERILLWTYANLPDFPVYGCRLAPSLTGPGGVDHISRLPRALMRDIVSRLPVKDAARTAVLSSRWRTIWLSTPLVLSDAHLLPKGHVWPLTPANMPAITAAVSRILEAHPGPFERVRLICTNMDSYRAQLARWLQLLASKGVQGLVLINRPWPRDLPLPATVFSITTRSPASTSASGSCPARPCCVAPHFPTCASWASAASKWSMATSTPSSPGAPSWSSSTSSDASGGCASASSARAYEEKHSVPTQNAGAGSAINAGDRRAAPGIKMSTSAMLTSVKVLSLLVCFGVRNDVKMVPTFLRCFPNAEKLHIMSKKCDQPTGHITLKSWEESGPIDNVASRINTMSIREFRGEPGEAAFLEYFCRSARVLRTAVVVMANPSFAPFSTDEARSKVKKCCKNMANDSCRKLIIWSNGPAGGEIWRFKDGADFSFHDPFSVAEVR
ncbi:unnamed protein product [Alopecurus aequalis]